MKLTNGKNRILLLLESQMNFTDIQERNEVSYKICQKGIAESVDLTRSRVSYIITDLIDKGLVKEHTRRVVGLKRRRKVYTLSHKGVKKSKRIREKVEKRKVTIYTKSNTKLIELKHIDSFIDSEDPLLTALNNITDDNVIDLTKIEKHVKDVFSGRTEELQFLKNRLRTVKNDGFSTILIKGKAGIGKTRLLNEFKDVALSEGFDFLMGKGHYDSLEPYLPFKEAFERFQNLNDTNPMTFSYTKEKNREEKKEKHSRDLIFSKTAENIRSLAQRHPLVIFIDDLQWADRSSLMLFHYLTEKLDDAYVLFICAYRTEDVNRTDFLNEVLQRMNRENLYEELELESLYWENTKEIVQGLIGREDVPFDFINIIHDTSEGNPLFVKEFVKQMLEDGSIDPKNDKYPSKKDDIELPELVDDIIERRVKKLDKENFQIVKIGSIIGEEVPIELLCFVIDIDTIELLDYVDTLTGIGLWENEPDEDVFYFTHGLIQLSVYNRISRPLRKKLHKLVAESMEELFEDEIEDYYSDLGFHYKRAEEFAKGYKYHLKAGDKAENVYAHENALEMYREALKLAEKGNLTEDKIWKILERLGDVNKILGKYDSSLELYEKIPIEKIEPKLRPKILRKIANVHEWKGEYDKAMKSLKEGLAIPDINKLETCRLLCNKASNEKNQGRYDKAEEDFLKSLELCKDLNSDRDFAEINQGLGSVYKCKNEYDKAIEYLKISLSTWEKINDIEGKSYSLNSLGNVYMKKGDLDKSLNHYKQGLNLIKELGDKRYIPNILNNIGTIYSKTGKLEKALEYYQRSKTLWEDMGNQQGIAVSLINIGGVYLRRGDLEAALENHEKSLVISKEIEYENGVAICLNNIGAIHLQKGELDEAQNYYQKGFEMSKSRGDQYLLSHTLCGLAEILIRKKEVEMALEKGKRSLEISKQIGAKLEEGMSRKVLGMAFRRNGELDKAKIEFETGKNILKKADGKRELAELLYEYGLFWENMGNLDKKKECLEEALILFEDIGMSLWIEKCKKELS